MGTGDSLSSHAPPGPAASVSAAISPLLMRCWSYPHMRATPARKQRRNPMMATPVLTLSPPPASAAGACGSFVSLDMELTLGFRDSVGEFVRRGHCEALARGRGETAR